MLISFTIPFLISALPFFLTAVPLLPYCPFLLYYSFRQCSLPLRWIVIVSNGYGMRSSVEEGQQSVDEVVVLAIQILQLSHSWSNVKVLLILVLLQGRLTLINFSSKAVVGHEHQGFDVLVVLLPELSHSFRADGVIGVEGVFEPQFLLHDPGEPALLDEDAAGQLGQNSRVELVELIIDLEVLLEEAVPLAVAL